MSKVLYESDGRIARITLNRRDVLNAIDDDVPQVGGKFLVSRSREQYDSDLKVLTERFT